MDIGNIFRHRVILNLGMERSKLDRRPLIAVGKYLQSVDGSMPRCRNCLSLCWLNDSGMVMYHLQEEGKLKSDSAYSRGFDEIDTHDCSLKKLREQGYYDDETN